jgi:uncharacterized SAM-binding protein YcdF (DUF218 family)
MLSSVELLVQPVALIAWGLLALVAVAWRSRAPPSVRWLAVAVAVGYFSASAPLGANLAVGMLEEVAAVEARGCPLLGPGGAVVVLAGGVTGNPASHEDVANLQLASLRRVLEGVRLARASPGAVVILSGGSGRAIREADLMASLATSLGLPAARLVLERDSTTTAEAADRVARLLEARQVEGPIRLVTTAMHVPRATASFRKRGVQVCPVLIDSRRVRLEFPEALLPQMTALDKTTAVVHEAFGYVAYRVAGRL